jgi:hypothetical protein
MKRKIAIGILVGLVMTAPVSAGPNTVFPTWEECQAAGAAEDHFNQWSYSCVEGADGWKLVWTMTKTRGRR